MLAESFILKALKSSGRDPPRLPRILITQIILAVTLDRYFFPSLDAAEVCQKIGASVAKDVQAVINAAAVLGAPFLNGNK